MNDPVNMTFGYWLLTTALACAGFYCAGRLHESYARDGDFERGMDAAADIYKRTYETPTVKVDDRG